MRIGLIGWYGHDNAGDERILHCLTRLFDDQELFVVGSLDVVPGVLDELNRCDFVLLGGGGLILRGTNTHVPAFAQITAPFGCIGISVEAVHDDNQAFIDLLREKSTFIHVRDAESARHFYAPDKTLSGVDVTFLYPYDVADVVPAAVCGVNLRDWRYWAGEHGSDFDLWMRRVNSWLPQLRTVYPLPHWSPAMAVRLLRAAFAELQPLSFYHEQYACTDAMVLTQYLGTSQAFTPELLARCRYLVAMRLHALIFACQQGIPFISLTYQPKNAQLCASMGLKRFSVDLYQLKSQLPPVIDALQAEHAALRAQVLAYREEAYQQSWADARQVRRAMGL